VLGALGYFFPTNGIILAKDLTLKFPSPYSLFATPAPKTDISKVLQASAAAEASEMKATDAQNSKDTSFIIQGAPQPKSILKERDSLVKLITGIQVKSGAALESIFEALYSLQQGSESLIRVLHYGDSQIEGDRITDHLRQKLQMQFGGGGPGLTSVMPLTSTIINKITLSPQWDRYNIFTAKDKRVDHKNYGVMAGFCRFSAYKKIYDTSVVTTSSISITTTKNGGAGAMAYKKVKLFYGGAKKRTWFEFYDGPALMAADSLEAGGFFKVKEMNAGNGSFTHTFKFKGKDSPDFYGISLESEKGVLVDNIPLRGSSGTFFHQINSQQLSQFYSYLNVKLIILQFGGNSLPAIQNETMAVNYASYLRGQIAILKKVAPSASILFIGPADMDVKEGTDYVTHPFLEVTRDAIKKVVLESNCAFYDMYDIMGGRKSMSAWVDEKLAATDYIHFSPKGARKVAALLHAAFINEYEQYLKEKH
jgi:lysophospholipase L1-like esterase